MATWETTDSSWGGGGNPTFADNQDSFDNAGFDNAGDFGNGDFGNGDFGNDGFGNSADGADRQEPTGACRRCNEEGHWARECPNAPAMTCRECGSPDHVVKECPEVVCKNCGEKGGTKVVRSIPSNTV